MIVVAQAAEVGALENLVAPASIEQIRALDLDTHFVLAVFQGRKLTDGYAIQVEHITRQEDQVTVLVEIQEPQTDARKNDIVTSPYHLVEVQKAGTWDQDVTFNLVIDDAVVASLSQYVP